MRALECKPAWRTRGHQGAQHGCGPGEVWELLGSLSGRRGLDGVGPVYGAHHLILKAVKRHTTFLEASDLITFVLER